MYDTVVVGADGSEGAASAVDRALGIAGRHDATLHAVAVVDTARYGEPTLSSAELVVTELEDRTHERLRSVAGRAADAGVPVVTRCCHGDPHRELLDYAERVEADLTVLGHRGSSRGTGVGSVADRLLRDADRPVLLA